MKVLVTRAAEDAEPLASEIRALGHEPVLEPLLAFKAIGEAVIPHSGFQAVLATSRQAIRALAARPADLGRLTALPLYAVGAATADRARAEGFTEVHEAEGDAASLEGLLVRERDPRAGGLLHLAGEHLATDTAGPLRDAGFEVVVATVYRMRAAAALTAATRDLITAGAADAVILMSPRTAATWARLVGEAGLVEPVRRMRHLCLSAAVARALAGLARDDVRCAATPTRAALLALLTD